MPKVTHADKVSLPYSNLAPLGYEADVLTTTPTTPTRLWIYITSLAVAILNFLLLLTLDSIHNRVLEFLYPENLVVAFEISFLGVTEPLLHRFILFMNGNIVITGFAAAILDGRVGMELQKMCHFVAPSYSVKVTKTFPLTPSGSEMATKRSVCG